MKTKPKSRPNLEASLEILHTVSVRISSTLDLGEVLNLLVESTLQLLPADAAQIFIYRPQQAAHERLQFGAAFWRDGRRDATADVPRPHGLTAIVAEQGEPIIIDNAREHPLFSGPVASTWGVESIAGFPLKKGRSTLGVFTVTFLQPHKISVEERYLLSLFADQAAVAIANAHITANLSQRLDEMTLLYNMAKEVGASLELDEVLKTVVSTLKSLLGVRAAYVLLHDELKGLHVAAQEGLPDDAIQSILGRPGEGAGGQVLLSGQPMHFTDLPQSPYYRDLYPGARSLLVVPLLVKGDVIGSLSIDSQNPNAFSAETERLLAIAASQAAIAIENAKLYQAARRRADELDTIFTLSRLITQSLEMEHVFAAAHQAISHLMPTEAFFITLRDRISGQMVAAYVVDKGVRYPPYRLDETSGLSGYVTRTGESVLVHDLTEQDLAVDLIQYGDEEDVRAIVAVPLRYGNQTIGMMSTQSYQPGAFSEHDLHLLQSIADHVATAVENAHLYADLQKRYQGLQEIDDARTEVIQNVSHELRNPLTYLTAYIDLLLQDELGGLNEDQRKGLEVIQAKSAMLVRLVEDMTMLEIKGEQWLRVQDVSLLEILRQAVTAGRYTAGSRSIEVMLEAPDTFCPVEADPDRIAQVMDNLLSNAIKFSPTNSKIVVRLQAESDRALVSVSDQGMGIPKNEQEQIFKRFYQVNNPDCRRRRGLGLGLAIVRHIIEAHHGKVWVESHDGLGSTFYFTLPYEHSLAEDEAGEDN